MMGHTLSTCNQEGKLRSNQAQLEVQYGLSTLSNETKLAQAQLGKPMAVFENQVTNCNWESGKTAIPFIKLLDILMICGSSIDNYCRFLRGFDQVEKK